MCVCMYVCTCVYVCVCVCMFVHVCMYVCVYMYVRVYVRMCGMIMLFGQLLLPETIRPVICMYVCMYVCMHVWYCSDNCYNACRQKFWKVLYIGVLHSQYTRALKFQKFQRKKVFFVWNSRRICLRLGLRETMRLDRISGKSVYSDFGRVNWH